METESFINKNGFISENPETALRQVRQSIEASKNEKEVLCALEVAFEYCLKQVPLAELEEKLFHHVCPTAENIFIKKLKALENSKIENFVEAEITNTCISCLKITGWFGSAFEHLLTIGQINVNESKTILISCGKLLCVGFRHCEISENVYGPLFNKLGETLSEFFAKNIELLDSFLKFLSENLLNELQEPETLNEVLRLLSKCGMSLIALDVKTMAKVWKVYASLAQKHSESLKFGNCVQESINNLSLYLSSNIESLFHLNEFDQDTQKLIKVSCFVLKLVIKFCEIFNGFLSGCEKSLFNTMLALSKWDSIIKTKIKTQNSNLEVVCQLTAGIDPLLSQLLSCQELVIECSRFSKELCEIKNSVPFFTLVLCLILKKLTNSHSTTRKLWYNNENNILDWLFQCISFGESQFSSNVGLPSVLASGRQTVFSDLYEYVLVNASAFAMTVTCSEFLLLEKILVRNLLQPEPLKALLSLDIWCTLARFESSELCFTHTQILSNFYKQLSGNTLRVEKCYLRSLILRLFPLLSETHKRNYISSISTEIYLDLFVNFEAFQVIDNTDWHKLFDAFLGDRLLESPSLKTLSVKKDCTVDEATLQKLEKGVVKYWEFNSELLLSYDKKERFLKSACSLAACILPKMGPENLFLVLNQLNKLFSTKQPPCIQLYGVHILTSAAYVQISHVDSQQSIIKMMAELFRCLLLSEDAMVKQKSLESFYFFAHVTAHEEVIPLTVTNSPSLKTEVAKFFQNKVLEKLSFHLDEYVFELHRNKYLHACQISGTNDVEKTDPEENVKQVKDRWKKDGKKILSFIELGLLAETEKEEIKISAVRIASLLT